MLKAMVYRDHPESFFESHKALLISAEAGDYFITITDMKTGEEIKFRYCISGGFEDSHPKTTMALAELHRAFVEENF